jgi:hypothetical protein
MDKEITLSKEEEEFLDSLFKESEFVCVNCLSSADVDEDQMYTYCEKCEAFTEVKKKGTA